MVRSKLKTIQVLHETLKDDPSMGHNPMSHNNFNQLVNNNQPPGGAYGGGGITPAEFHSFNNLSLDKWGLGTVRGMEN